MGLRDYKKYKREQELKDSETISFLLKRIAELEGRLNILEEKVAFAPVSFKELSEDEKKKLTALQDKKTRPEDFIKLFADEVEEFDPNA